MQGSKPKHKSCKVQRSSEKVKSPKHRLIGKNLINTLTAKQS